MAEFSAPNKYATTPSQVADQSIAGKPPVQAPPIGQMVPKASTSVSGDTSTFKYSESKGKGNN